MQQQQENQFNVRPSARATKHTRLPSATCDYLNPGLAWLLIFRVIALKGSAIEKALIFDTNNVTHVMHGDLHWK